MPLHQCEELATFPCHLSFTNDQSTRADGKRRTSIKRGLDFIYRIASKPEGLDSYGSLLICCFALMGATSRDASLRQLARSRAQNSPNAGAVCIQLFHPMPPRIWSSILS